MSLVTASDLVAFVAYGVAFVVAAIIPVRARSIGRGFKSSLMAALGLLLFVSTSNVLEHAGITAALDAYEDYAEVLFVPLVAYILYSRSTAEQLVSARAAENATRQEHQLLMSVVETTPTGILVADAHGVELFSNDTARQLMDTAGRPGGSSRDEGRTLDLASIVRDAPVRDVRYSVGAAESPLWLSVRATPLAAEGSGEPHAVVVLEDITRRVETETELEHYRRDLERLVDRRTGELLEVNRQLQSANEAGQRFLANMSHELRTPLNAIIGFTDVLLREMPGPLNAEQRKQLELVKDSGAQLLVLVDGVLDLARIESGHGAIVLGSVDLGAATRAVVAPMQALADVRGVELRCSCPDGPVVTSDIDKFGQIVRNLVSNALKFTDSGGIVSVDLAIGEEIRLTVADTGIGIAPVDQERVFEAFQQVATPERVRQQGTGLGLAICRELCGLLGYRLTLESEVGRGSVFTVHMPSDPNGAAAPPAGERVS